MELRINNSTTFEGFKKHSTAQYELSQTNLYKDENKNLTYAKAMQKSAAESDRKLLELEFGEAEDVFVFTKRRPNESNIFDFFIADGEEGKLLNSMKKLSDDFDAKNIDVNGIKDMGNIIAIRRELHKALKNVQDVLIKSIRTAR